MMMGTAIIYSATYTSTALADKDDTFNFTAGTLYMYDTNLFRAPAGANPPFDAERSDSMWKTNVGISIDKDYSLQKFKFDYWHEETKFNNNDFLDFNGNNYNAAWLWAVTPGLKGTLSSKRTVDLVPFIDFQGFTRNVRTTKFQNFDFDYSPHNKWHLLGGVSKLDVENSQVFIQEQSFKFDGVEAGVKYTFPSESFFKFMVRRRDGEQVPLGNAFLVSDGFKEDEQELSMFWLVSGKSRIISNLGHLKREDNDYSVRDFSGWFGGINYAWDITGKLNLTVDLSRRIAAFQDFTSSYTTIDTIAVKPTWAVTSKIKVSANAQYGHRKFLNDGVQQNFGRNDDMVSYGVSADWTPRDTMKFGLNLRHEERDSNAVNRDYSADIASINGQLTF
ncbi:MAG: putative exosortase B-associated extracellular polysaccharide biosynthesis transporter EpsL [Methylotenera sp.]|nr:MAG: putative exosortase B-associated extracellular polysaccharide biosynthesis transporter EpsL [Methylotenera sp.]